MQFYFCRLLPTFTKKESMREIQAPNVIYELFKKSFDKCERKWTATNFWRKAKGPYTFPKTISFLLNYWWDVQIQLFNLSWRNLAILLTHTIIDLN